MSLAVQGLCGSGRMLASTGIFFLYSESDACCSVDESDHREPLSTGITIFPFSPFPLAPLALLALCGALSLVLFTLATPEPLNGAGELLLLSEEVLGITRFATPGLGRALGTEARDESEEVALDVARCLDDSDVEDVARCFKESEAEPEEGGLV